MVFARMLGMKSMIDISVCLKIKVLMFLQWGHHKVLLGTNILRHTRVGVRANEITNIPKLSLWYAHQRGVHFAIEQPISSVPALGSSNTPVRTPI